MGADGRGVPVALVSLVLPGEELPERLGAFHGDVGESGISCDVLVIAVKVDQDAGLVGDVDGQLAKRHVSGFQ